MAEIPILYLYIYRQILNGNTRIKNVIEIKQAMRRVIHTCPSLVLDGIIDELCSMDALQKVNQDKYLVSTNAQLSKSLRRLKPHVFPIIN